MTCSSVHLFPLFSVIPSIHSVFELSPFHSSSTLVGLPFSSCLLSSFSPLVLSIYFILSFLTCFSPLASASCFCSLSFLLLLTPFFASVCLCIPFILFSPLHICSYISFLPSPIHLSEHLFSPFLLLPAPPLHPCFFLSVVLLRLPVSPPASLSGCAGSLLCTPP